jgi:hypothetical protein
MLQRFEDIAFAVIIGSKQDRYVPVEVNRESSFYGKIVGDLDASEQHDRPLLNQRMMVGF